MPVFESIDQADLLGMTPLVRVGDDEIYRHLVTPTIKGLLGKVLSKGETRILDTTEGLFAGDEVTNLNGHLLATGKEERSLKKVRFPYRHTVYYTERGAIIVKADGVKFEVFCWFGNIEKGRAELVLKAGLRDRRYDGTARANDSALLEFTYDHPLYHQRLSSTLSSVELSIYGFMPSSRALDATGEEEYDRFLRNPYCFLEKPEVFLAYFERAFASKYAPGQNYRPVPDIAQVILPGFESIAKRHGYDLIEMAASHYHVAKWSIDRGYKYADPAQEEVLRRLACGLEEIRAAGHPLSRIQQSWACVLQSLRPVEKIPAHLYMGSQELLWPQNNLNDVCLWVYKPLSQRAHGFVPAVSFSVPPLV